MAVSLKYQGKSKGETAEETNFTEIYFGTEAECQSYFDSLSIGTYDSSKGNLSNKEKRQGDGPLYEVTVTWTQRKNEDGSWSNDGADYGKKASTLSARMMQMALESHPSYLYNWNHTLWELCDSSVTEPAWWATATSGQDADGETYRWTSSEADCPDLSDDARAAGKKWLVCKAREMKADYYEMGVFEITETVKAASQTAAGNYVEKKINQIVTPTNGTFGITGGNWKCDGSTCSYNGKHWIVTTTYSHSPDGWDPILYP